MDGKSDRPAETPVGIAITEVDRLREIFHATVAAYSARVDSELAAVRAALAAHADDIRLSSAKTRDVRDMLTLLRNAQVKSDKGRRKDIKKIDSVVGDLQMLVETWQK